jgi:hypothetical protein
LNPTEIIRLANEAGVTLSLCRDGAIDIGGEVVAVNRWLPAIREHKPGIVAALQDAANDSLRNPAAVDRRQRVLVMLNENPNIRRAVVVDNAHTDPVTVTVGVRGVATFELAIPAAKFDGFRLIDLIDRRGGVTGH